VPYDTENGYQLVKCVDCGLLYVSPRPSSEEITTATKTGQHRGDNIISVTGKFSNEAVKRYLKILGDFFPNEGGGTSTWLDVGCGHGEFLIALQKYFNGKIIGRGCEPNLQKVASAQSKGLNVEFFDLATHDVQYDNISILNVFSHLPDPVEMLSLLKNLLKPGGLLFLETGHSAHLSASYQPKPYDLPDHLSFANRQIVEDILMHVNLQPMATKLYSFASHNLNFMRFTKEALKCMIGRRNRFREYFSKNCALDMFILAKNVS
jgi:SAM-dependent methyltransferase